MTAQRRVILEELCSVTSHPTAGELCDMVRQRLPRISLGTVYRNLEALSQAGVIQKIEVAGREKRFDATVENHYHVRCSVCGRVADVDLELEDTLESKALGKSPFVITGHRLEFEGLCPECAGVNLTDAQRRDN